MDMSGIRETSACRDAGVPRFITIRRETNGYGIRFGLTEAEDKLRHGPVFETLPEALAWIARIDQNAADDAGN